MIKEAIQYLVSLKENKTYEIGGDTYSDQELVRIPPHVARPARISVTGLDSIVKLVRNELDMFDNLPVFIRVDGARTSPCSPPMTATWSGTDLYEAKCDVPGFRDGFRGMEAAIIELRSKFAPGEGVDYLLDLLSRISTENGVTTRDNGVSQEVEARQGISLKAMVQVKPRVSLRPYRTFLEVEQPESEFLLRVDAEEGVGLFEADGGMWAMEAKRRIAAYFEEKLAEEVTAARSW